MTRGRTLRGFPTTYMSDILRRLFHTVTVPKDLIYPRVNILHVNKFEKSFYDSVL